MATKIHGYINTKTDVMISGQHELFDMLSNPNHVDNRARLDTFAPNDPEGQLDWRAITTAKEWSELCKRHGFDQPANV